MKKKTSKAMAILLTLALMLMPMAVLTACWGPRNLTIEDIEDVSPDDWFYRYVVAGIRFGIIRGERGESLRFEPDEDITLGEFITMLGRLHEYGHGTIGAPGDGPDYERYMDWAKERGIILDHPDWEDLTPSTLINRERIVAIVSLYIAVIDLHDYFCLYDYFYQQGYFLMLDTHSIWSAIRDRSEISHWAQGAVIRLRSMLILSSGYRGYFKPHDPVTRAEALQIIIRVGSAVYDLLHPLMLM